MLFAKLFQKQEQACFTKRAALDIIGDNDMDENSNFWLQLILGTIVLIPSIWTILKSYYDKFKISVISDEIYFGIHEWDGDRFEIRFFIPMELINISNSTGIITDMRLKLRYPIKWLFHYSEYLTGDFELISQKDKNFDFSARGNSIDQIIKSKNISFPLKSKQHCQKHILFRTFWSSLRLIDDFQVILEIQLNNKRWKKYGKWAGHLCQFDYNLYISNDSPIPLMKESKNNRIILKWRQHMILKINEKYGTDVTMNKVKIPPSKSKW